MQIIIGLVLGFSLFYRSINYDEDKSPHWTCMPLEMHLYGLHNERVSVFDLSYFVLKQYKAFYRYIFVSCLWGIRWVSVHHCEALDGHGRKSASSVYLFDKITTFCWYCECTQNKSRPFTVPNDVITLTFMSKNDSVGYFELFPLLEKNASDCTGTSMSCRARFSCLPLSTQTIGYASILTLWYAWTDLYL